MCNAPTGAQPWAMLPEQCPARTACGSAEPPYTPQKASRVVSKLSPGQFAQKTAYEIE